MTSIGAAGRSRRLGQVEFVAMMAALVALTAFSIDAMLPGIDEIAAELSPEAPNLAQLVIPLFALGMGVGTLFVGPLADAFGRRPVIFAGAALYIAASALGWIAGSIEMLFAARFAQGVAAAIPRIAAMAVIRDLFVGRGMARIMSFILMVFALVPAIAPAMAAGLMEVFGWRAVFPAFILFSLLGTAWFALRQGETLPTDRRRPLARKVLGAGLREIFASPLVRRVMAAQSLVFGMLFAILSSSQPIFDRLYGRDESFPYWFGLAAVIAASASLLNARIVDRVGMRPVIGRALGAELAVSAGVLVIALTVGVSFPLFFLWMTSVFFMVGLCIGNLNALGMEPLGHLAGLAASVIGAVSTVCGALLAVPATLALDGSALPLAGSVFVFSAAALALVRGMRRHAET